MIFTVLMEGTHYPIIQQPSAIQVISTVNGGNAIETIRTFTGLIMLFNFIQKITN